MAELTPMKQQYNEIKSKYPDTILFFRLGDFYEMFDEDAKKAAAELDLALTTRDRGKSPEEQTPMCGVPYHSAQAYIGRLIQKGYKIAVCEQVEDPATAKGLVKRDVVRVITPGTVTDPDLLDASRSNYVCALTLDGDGGAVAFCDISTGEFCATAFAESAVSHLENELACFMPSEIVLSEGAAANAALCDFILRRIGCMTEVGGERFGLISGEDLVCRRFGAENLAQLGLADMPSAVTACGALLSYIGDTQKCDLAHINKLDLYSGERFMELDYTTRRSLELTENLRTGEKRGSLLWALDRTKTPMGGRALRSWVERPLLSPVAIKRRQAAIGELVGDSLLRAELGEALSQICDMQRLVSRVVYGSANGRDLLMLALCCNVLPRVRELLSGCRSNILEETAAMDTLDDVAFQVLRAICDEPPLTVKEGGVLREGYSEEVDRLRRLRDNGTAMIAELEARERERTGIKKLKVGYNKVFGYFIDVPNSAKAELPPEYIRKQTLVSNERYFTQELKELENQLANARDRVCELEYQFFCEVRNFVAEQVGRIQSAANLIARLDALLSLADCAARGNYVCPEVDLSDEITIREGRHPVVELSLKDELFVPNDCVLNTEGDRALIVTGPNMAGKSTFMRQTALIVLMAQIGSFVPAKSATLGIVDRVFTRIGAADDIAAGQSTFMVEMSEVSAILKNATERSLIILDEVGRGTSTYDGMAIARAVLEYCADKKRLGAKTMFATHYHELTALERLIPGVKNYHITAKKKDGTLIFLRKVIPGAADDSYGVEVAKLAGVPAEVLTKARAYLRELENGAGPVPAAPQSAGEAPQLSLEAVSGSELVERLRGLTLETLTPIEALNLLYELKKKAEG